MRISITNYYAATISTSGMELRIFKVGEDTAVQFKLQSDPNVRVAITLNPDEVEQFIKDLCNVNPDIQESLYEEWRDSERLRSAL